MIRATFEKHAEGESSGRGERKHFRQRSTNGEKVTPPERVEKTKRAVTEAIPSDERAVFVCGLLTFAVVSSSPTFVILPVYSFALSSEQNPAGIVMGTMKEELDLIQPASPIVNPPCRQFGSRNRLLQAKSAVTLLRSKNKLIQRQRNI